MGEDSRARLTVSGREVTVDFDLDALRGDVLETLEDHLGGVGVYVWLRRWVDAMEQGARISEFRTRDIIGLVYLGMAQADPDTTWEQVSRGIAPYTLRFLADEPQPAARPVTVGVSPDLGQQVPAPEASVSPTLAAMHPPVPAPPAPHEGLPDLYRAS